MHVLVPCMSTENLHSANSLLVDNLVRLFYLLPKYFFQSKCISSNVSFMFLHSAGLIQVRMIDIFSFHSFLCNNFSASRLSSHFHFLILMEPTLPLMFSNMIYFFKGKKLYTLHKSTSIFLLIQYLWTLPTRANLWQKYPKVSVLRYSKNRNLKEFILV